jgi:hypothetical protein
MKYLTKALFSALVLGIVACGGVSDDTKLVELSDDDIADLCSEVAVIAEKDCGGGFKVSNSPEECTAELKNVPTSCEATAGDARTCNELEDPCQALANASCQKLAPCASNSGG